LEKTFWQQTSRLLFVTIAIISLLIGAYYLLPLVYPFIIGVIFSLIFNPLVDYLGKKAKFPRWLSVTLAIVLLLTIIVTIVVLVAIEIVSEINYLQKVLPEYLEDYITQIQHFILYDLVTFYDQFSAFYSTLDLDVRKNIQTQVESFSDQLVELGQATITGILNGALAFIGAIPSMATAFIISLLASFFISKDWPKLESKLKEFAPDRFHTSGGAVLKDLKKALFGFVKAQLTLISITFVIMLIGLMILGVEYALTIALVTATLDLLPYLGTGLVFIPWIVYLFINGDYSLVIGLSILYGIIVVQRQMMEPKILGTNVGLDPLLTLIALFVGFQLFGMIGLIIGPVIMVIIGALTRAGVFRDMWNFIRGTSTKT
jgi:sporulation integral membrane protein YtvI